MNSSDAVLKKLESLLGPSPELYVLIENSNIQFNLKSTPYQILQELFGGVDLKIVKHFVALSPACRRTYIFAANLDSEYRFYKRESKRFFELILALPQDQTPMTKEHLLLARTVLKTWPWEASLFGLQVQLHGSFETACEQYEKYGYKLLNLMSALRIKSQYVQPLLNLSMRSIYEKMSNIREQAIEEFIQLQTDKTWEGVYLGDKARFGHTFFQEITSMDRMLELAKKYNNCLLSRIACALDGSRRYFEVSNKAGLVGLLEIELTVVKVADSYTIRQWKELDFVDTKNETIEHVTFRRDMHAFIAKLNEDMGDPEIADYYEECCHGHKSKQRRALYTSVEILAVPQTAMKLWMNYLKDRFTT